MTLLTQIDLSDNKNAPRLLARFYSYRKGIG
jgi:hypothetical protein